MRLSDARKGGDYIDPDGCSWRTPEGFLHGYVMGFCCCGQPEMVLAYVRDVLRDIKNQSCPDKDSAPTYLVWYWLDSKDFTEHGGSVPGWLTDKGRDLLADLETLDLD